MNLAFLFGIYMRSGTTTRVGWLQQDGQWDFLEDDRPALESLFEMTHRLLLEKEAHVSEIRSFLFCDGPGSVLGLRLASMAIQTWQALSDIPIPVFQYRALSLAALGLIEKNKTHSSHSRFTIWTDWKKKAARIVTGDAPFRIDTLESQQLEDVPKPLFYLTQRKSWQTDARFMDAPAPYPFHDFPRFLLHPEFLKKFDLPTLPETELNTFVIWSGERHRAGSK